MSWPITLCAAVAATLPLAASAEGPIPGRTYDAALPEDAVPPPRGDVLLREAMLLAHNNDRTAVKMKPLVWDAALAADADLYARELAKAGEMRHSTKLGDHGENLWVGTSGAYSYAQMIDSWSRERAQFVNEPTPRFSRTPRWEDVAHYTQIVWHGTTKVGCAVASNEEDDYLVCRYDPGGNVTGERAY